MRDERLYLADILEAAEAVSHFVAGMTEDDWIEDEVKHDAVMYRLIIIGGRRRGCPKNSASAIPRLRGPTSSGFATSQCMPTSQ